MTNRKKIKQYWDQRAAENAGVLKATTDDIYLRELEIATVISALQELQGESLGKVLDIGCGDGYSTLEIAKAFPQDQFLGIDYSRNMIKSAQTRLFSEAKLQNRVCFKEGDATKLADTCSNDLFDIILSFRCLINLNSLEVQSNAVKQIAAQCKPGGFYIAIENFVEGQNEMNRIRHVMGLPEIPTRWHNLYFKEIDFRNITKRDFKIINFIDFSSAYYYATRVVYSAMCQMKNETPDYSHEIHKLAVKLPFMGKFSPIRMVILQKK